MKIEELKEWANDPDRYAHWKAYQKDTFIDLAPEILALVEAAQSDYGHCEAWATMKALDAFEARLEEL